MGDLETLSIFSQGRTQEPEHSNGRSLDDELSEALDTSWESLSKEIRHLGPREQVRLIDRCTIQGLRFANSSATKRNSLVFFLPSEDGPLIPGVIRQIFSVSRRKTKQEYLLAIHRYLPATTEDPFGEFIDFGAGIWSKALAKEVEIVPAHRTIGHAIQRGWDANHFVMKSLHRVCYCPCIDQAHAY